MTLDTGDTPADDAALVRLRRVLGTPDTEWLLLRLRARLERFGELTGRLTKTSATAGERLATARLTGRSVRAGAAASVSLDELDEVLRRPGGAWPAGLVSAVIALTGTVVSPGEREADRDAWRDVTEALREVAIERSALVGWVDSVIRGGNLRRIAGEPVAAMTLVDRLRAIASELPSVGESLGVFAARIAGDAHALDASTPLGGLATSLAFALGNDTDLPPVLAAHGSAGWRRDAWLSVNVIVDELSSTVLALGLPGGEDSATAMSLRALASSGEPTLLTLRQLARDGLGKIPDNVFVCENPAVMAAAAERWGPVVSPLVCISGQPSAAAILLLQKLVAGGATLHYHGDFDWGGLAIARTLAQRVPWSPWRFAAADYELATESESALPALIGIPGQTPWDADLAPRMAAIALKVEEERVLRTLLDDLGPASDDVNA